MAFIHRTLLSVVGSLLLCSQVCSQQLKWTRMQSYFASFCCSSEAAVHKSGCSYVTGITIRDIYPIGYRHRLYIFKYDPSGAVLWADTSGGTFGLNWSGVVSDEAGNAFVTTYVSGQDSIHFGNSWFPGNVMYLLKYSPGGQLLWVLPEGSDSPAAMNIDKQGNIYISGYDNPFTAKYDKNGTLLWKINRSYFEISVDDAGRVHVPRSIYSSSGNLIADFGPSGAESIATDSQGNCFLTDFQAQDLSTFRKYDAFGNGIWSYSLSYSGARGIDVDQFGNTYVGGHYDDPQYGGILVSKYDPSGNLLWTYDQPDPDEGHNNDITSIRVQDSAVFVSGYMDLENQAFLLKLASGNPSFVATRIAQQSIVTPSVFPNPASGWVTVTSNGPSAINSIAVLNLTGGIMLQQFCQGDTVSLDLSSLSAGAYEIQILYASGLKSSKKVLIK
jgi:hypothetical protein